MTDDQRTELAALCASIKAPEPYPFDDDDYILLGDAQTLDIIDGDTYAAGFKLLKQLTGIEKAVDLHYEGFKKPLNLVREIVIAEAKLDAQAFVIAKASLSKRLTDWKTLADEADAEDRRRAQAEADAEAARIRDARTATLRNVAATERDPVVRDSLIAQAEAVAAIPAVASEVVIPSTAPTSSFGFVKKRYKPNIVDVRALLRAWLDGKVQLDIEQDLIEAITPRLADAAKALGPNISKVYPGVTAVEDKKAVSR